MLDNVGGYRPDKVKFAIELTPAESIIRKNEFVSVFGDDRGSQGGRSYNVVSVKFGKEEGTYLYIFDVWGDACKHLDELPFDAWYKHLSRVDVRTPYALCDEGLDEMYLHLQKRLKGRRSVDRYNRPIRMKVGNRDAGGSGLSIGTHKSAMRITWYLRGHEDGALEFQVQAEKLQAVIGSMTYRTVYAPTPLVEHQWQEFIQGMVLKGNLELDDLTGMYEFERSEVLRGNASVHQTIEHALEAIEGQIKRLPNDALNALYYMLQERLFGAPEPIYYKSDSPVDVEAALGGE